MKTFKDFTSDEVFAFLREKILLADALLGVHQYMVIGSYARDIHLAKAGFPSPRGTQDLDFSIAAENFSDFQNALDAFGPAQGLVTRRSLGGIPVDIIPFGAIANNGSPEYGDSHWELRGLQEAYDSAMIFELGETSVKIPSIHAMMGLKIIAWGERMFPTDCTDFHHLLLAACSLATNRGEIWGSELWNSMEIVDRYEGDPELLTAYSEGIKLAEVFAGDAVSRCYKECASEQSTLFVATALRECRNDLLYRNYKKVYDAFFNGVMISTI